MTDHLDNETSLHAELTEKGLAVGAKSRTIAALDRLGGALVDNLNARLEGGTAKRRAVSEGEVALIQNIVDYGIKELGAKPEQAERAFRQHFKKVIAAQENKDAVLGRAVEELKDNPPADDVKGDISEDFFARFEQHAEVASSENVRELFGRILASEIRKPGSISPSTMHFASMLDAQTAKLIDTCASCIDGGVAILSAIDPELGIPEKAQLALAGFWEYEKYWNPTLKSINGICNVMVDPSNRAIRLGASAPVTLNFQAAFVSKEGVELLYALGKRFDAHLILAQKCKALDGVHWVEITDTYKKNGEFYAKEWVRV